MDESIPAGLLLLMLYMAGVFTPGKIPPGKNESPRGDVPPSKTAKVSVAVGAENRAQTLYGNPRLLNLTMQ